MISLDIRDCSKPVSATAVPRNKGLRIVVLFQSSVVEDRYHLGHNRPIINIVIEIIENVIATKRLLSKASFKKIRICLSKDKFCISV